MQLIKTIKDMQAFGRRLKAERKSLGFVPTMGALHEGHLSLARRSIDENDFTVVSIFVNPAQFGPNEDFKKYPRDTEGDLQKLSPFKVDAVFLPDAAEMYTAGFSTSINIGNIGTILCGASRPGHFNGVATVVAKLFNAVTPDRAYFGQKDFQQTVVINKLARELNFATDIIVCPTVREPDGLAMSSRNTYLNSEERKAALILYKALKLGEELIISNGMVNAVLIKEELRMLIHTEPLAVIDYVEIVAADLGEVEKIKLPVAICLAVKLGKTRLIDNIIVDRFQRKS
ncbi:MAG: pantoate--beta-alanine ligase [Nitrospirae bacterium]|nr:pantoate--beta-alanine ligase [Nitrospirota bacterium]MBI4849256.1 pantoate--beta-alanine ligase [Nitrospirota bacterium]